LGWRLSIARTAILTRQIGDALYLNNFAN
jgi:hypothetical protein